jgi:hypothetical protein
MQAVPIRLLGNAVEMRDHFLLLKWLIFTAVSVFGFVLLWHFDMIQQMVARDVSYISLVILIVYALTSVHALSVTIELSSEINTAHRVREQIMGGTDGYRVIGDRVLLSDGTELMPGILTSHISNIANKARKAQGHPIDQTPLMRSLADELRSRQNLGHFSADLQLKLGLVGTIVGFIYMLLPLDSLEDFSIASMKSVLTFMSTGMGVALYATLAGLVGAILVKMQYYFIDEATQHLFGLTTELTEIHVVSALDKGAAS